MAYGKGRSGAQALVESLERAGTEVLFGYPGGNVADIFDRIPSARFRFVLGRHEQGCVHMADGYARATGRPGVAIVTSGPGLTNTVTALGAAYMDGIPLILVSGQVPLSQIGTDAFQEADTTGITRAVSKHNFLVQSADEIPETVAQAFYIATHGKPGPVVIDIPRNCQEEITRSAYPERISLRAYHPESTATSRDMNRLARLINDARRPVLYAGGGTIAAGAARDVAALSRKASIPVATTLTGIGGDGAADGAHTLGLAGMHGSPAANRAIAEADLLIALGVRFNDRITGKVSQYARKAKIVHVDCDPSSIGKNVPVDLGIVADVKDVLTTVFSRVKAADRTEWLEKIRSWRESGRIAEKPSASGAISPRELMEAIDRRTKGDAIVATDVGQHQIWAAQMLSHRRSRHFLTSGGMGAMGFGIPAAIGAAIAFGGEKRVVAILGDGGAQMTAQELAVAAEEKLPIAFVVVNNRSLGMVRQMQDVFFAGNRAATVFKGKYLPDFRKLASAYGIRSRRVERADKLAAAVGAALSARGPFLLEVMVDPEANVEPMVFR
ncbi:MAG: biosynthetic-type acetolactate synthase large subunit [Kiritimatiellae bacterium]|nr:biosynthetic-type acetolactate synthase large subunit [Kiritimatiellia bacterium]